MYIVASLLGAIAGVIGFIPLMFLQRQMLRGNALLRARATSLGLVGVGLSLIISLACLLVCWRIAPDVLLFFAGALILAFLATAITMAIISQRR
jgi:hypothetical protein